MSDYETLRSEAGLITDVSGLIWVRGPDAITFLDGLLSQNVAAMQPGTGAPSLLLAPNGKLRAHLWLLRSEDGAGLVCDSGRIDVVLSDLSRFKIRVDVNIALDDRPLGEVWGPKAAHALLRVPSLGHWRETETGVVASVPFRHSDFPRYLVVGNQPNTTPISSDTATAVRIELGEPVVGADLDESTIPQEGGDVAAAVDFTKGCYLGQELVARIDSRGHVNRRLAGLLFSGPAAAVGSPILHDGATVGTVTSAAWSEGLGAGVGLGMVRVEVDDGQAVSVGDREASVVALPIRA